MKTKKVFYFLKESYGGANSFIKIFLKINNKNFKTQVFCFEKNSSVINKIRYLSSSLTSDAPNIYKLTSFIKNLYIAYKLIVKENPSILIAGDNFSFILLHLLWPLIANDRILVLRVGNNLTKLINSKPNLIYRWLVLYLIKFFVKKTVYFICQTISGKKDFIKTFKPDKKVNIYIVNNGINLKDSMILAQKEIVKSEAVLFKENSFNIITTGRFTNQKDFSTIIKAFQLAYYKNPRLKLFIVGDGKLNLNLKKFIKKLNLHDSIFLLGWKKNIFPYLKLANLYIFSSKYEGFPFSLLEAMSQGLPIISTNTPFGPSEILDKGKYGVLVPVGDYKLMANKLIKLSKSKLLIDKYSKLSYERVKYFSEYKMKNNYRKLFKEICKKL